MIEQTLSKSASIPAPRPALPWTRWVFPRSFDVVSSVLYVGTLALFFYDRLRGAYAHPLIGWQGVAISGAVATLLAVDRLEYWRYRGAPPARVAAGLLLLRIGLIELVAQLDDFSFSPFLYLIIPFTASLTFSSRVSTGLAVLNWVVFLAKFSWYQPAWTTDPAALHLALLFTVGLVFAMAMARVIKQERASRARAEQLLAALEQSHRQLQAYAGQIEELAVAQERNRLARDIHDSLGHYLTVINVQLEKARAFRATRPGEADQAVSDAKRLAGEALQDVRRSVGALRAAPQEPFALGAALAVLIDNLRDSGFRIQVHVEGAEEGYTLPALQALYRAAQEALTNVEKHAGAAQVEVALRYTADAVCLEVRDDGQGFDPARLRHLAPGREGGYGLQGVQERLALVGGQLRVTSTPGAGTVIQARVPRQPAAGAGAVPDGALVSR